MKKVVLMLSIILTMLWSTVVSVMGAESKPVMVVATFDAKGFTQEDVEFVMGMFTSNFATLGFAEIVDRSNFDKIKKELSFQDSDWSDSKKVAELGRALNANLVATGQLMKRGTTIFLLVKILDVNTTGIITSHTDRVKNIDEFFDKMPEFCEALISKSGHGVSYAKYKIGDVGPGGGKGNAD